MDAERLRSVFEGQGMTAEEAEEWIAYHLEGAWVGDRTPIILYRGE